MNQTKKFMHMMKNSQVRDRERQALRMAVPFTLLSIAIWAVVLLSSPAVETGLAMAAGLH